MAQLLSVNVGLPRNIEWKGKSVYTAVWKEAVGGSAQGGSIAHWRRHRIGPAA
jgi:hypothetical protein